MKIEHVAYQMPEPRAAAEWYSRHLGMKIVRADDESPFMHFLADESGKVLIEIYNNPIAPSHDYPSEHPLMLHLAFVSQDVEGDADRLVQAGAIMEGQISTTPAGDKLAMLRDPWGFCIQLCKRAESMLS